MRVLTRALVALLAFGILVLGAFLLADAAIGPPLPQPTTDTSGTSRPAGENWRTHTGLLEGIPVGIALAADFVSAWIGMSGLAWLFAAGAVATLAIVIYLLRRLLRRHANRPLPV
jgi:hypothetical protein